MKSDAVVKVLNALGCKHIKVGGEWVNCSCPFAEKTHEKGRDNNPSFGVTHGYNKQSRYNCMACGRKGIFTTLPTALTFLLEKDFTKAADMVGALESHMDPNEHTADEGLDYELTYAPELSEGVLKKFMQPRREILDKRKIAWSTSKDMEIRWDPAEARLAFLWRDIDGRLVGIRGRYMGDRPDQIPHRAYIELSPSGKDPKTFGVWYGMHQPLKPGKLLILVEGEIDLIQLKQRGYANVWASGGAAITKSQMRMVANTHSPVCLFLDNDKSGKDAAKRLASFLLGEGRTVYLVTRYNGLKDPDQICVAGKVADAFKGLDKKEGL